MQGQKVNTYTFYVAEVCCTRKAFLVEKHAKV
jgi:hypothetical protein